MKAKLDKDLGLIGILTILLAIVIIFVPTTAARIILGLPFLLFFPGYTFLAALLPKKESLGGVERVALSFGLSIAVVPLIGLVLNFTPWGIRLYPILISVAAFIIATSGVAWYRRQKLAPEQRFAVSFRFRLPSWQGQRMPDKVLSIILIVVIMATIGTLGYVIATPRVGERFTEFYILGPGGRAENYPRELKVGQEGSVIVGIVNHEQERVSYKVEIWIDGQRASLRIDGQERDKIVIELQHGKRWRQKVGFVPQRVGNQTVEFVLYKAGERYLRPLHLGVDVTA